MAVWNVPHERRQGPRRAPRALRELAARLGLDPVRAWEWVERLQSTQPDDDPTNRARGAVATPHAIAMRMAAALVRDARPGDAWRILDPGCGRGRLLAAAARAASERSCSVDCEGVELDAAAARWAQALEALVRTGAQGHLRSWRVRRADFLLSPSPSADCDAVIANPPYVPVRALDAVARQRL